MIVALFLAATTQGRHNLDDRARAIEGQLRCPTCQGLSIADSPATAAAQMRALVEQQLAAGATDDAVRAFFVARYGRWVLLDPPMAGFDLVLWLAPAVVVAIGALLVTRRARARTGRAVRTWRAAPAGSASRLSGVVVAAGMAIALGVPIAAAVGPRLAGTPVSGGVGPQATPSIDALEAFVRADPNDVEAIVTLGDALLAADRAAEAADRFKQVLQLDPQNVDALLGLGAILLGANRPDAAGPVFDRVLAITPDQPDALLYRALAQLRLNGGLSDAGRADVERFLALAPADDPRREMAASMLAASSAVPDASGPVTTTRPRP